MEYINKETYSLRIITNWCTEKNIDFKYSSYKSRVNFLYEHGIRIKLSTFDISIQTHPDVCAWAFAETLKSNDMTSDIRHITRPLNCFMTFRSFFLSGSYPILIFI